MFVFDQSGSSRANGLYCDKSGCIWESGCIGAKVVVFGQTWLYSGKSGYIRAIVVLFGQKCLYSGKVVVLGQKWL